MRKITDDVIYIGLDDFDIDLFESQYKVPQGVSYNSYLILDEKIAIMDTADARKGEEWEANLKRLSEKGNLTIWSFITLSRITLQ